jgi:O-antigen ligase
MPFHSSPLSSTEGAHVSSRLKKNTAAYLLFFLLLFMNLQTLSVSGWVFDKPEDEITVKVYQLLLLLLAPVVFYSFSTLQKHTPRYVWQWVLWVIFSSLIGYSLYGFNTLIVNYLLAFIAMFMGILFALSLPTAFIIKIIRYVLFFIVLAVYVKMLIFLDEIIYFFRNPWMGHPHFPMFHGGGPNLEATWLAFFSAFFISNRRKWLFYFVWLACMGVALIYASRVAIVMNLISFFLFYTSPYARRWERQLFLVFGAVAFVYLITFIDWQLIGEKLVAVQRLLSVGGSEDKGMQGRFHLWSGYAQALRAGWWSGTGAGNTVPVMELLTKKSFVEDNVHNIYMQFFSDFGVIGGLLFLILAFNILKDFIKYRANLFLLSLVLYLIAGLVQFRGGEPYFYLILGLYIGKKYEQPENQCHQDHSTHSSLQ